MKCKKRIIRSSYPNTCKFVASQREFMDDAHDLEHCLDVAVIVKKYSPNNWTKFVIPAAILHEMRDRKFMKRAKLQSIDVEIRDALLKDGLNPSEIGVILELIEYCSFSRREEWLKRVHQYDIFPSLKPHPDIIKMMILLSSADLFEAVAEKAAERSYLYNRQSMMKNGTDTNSVDLEIKALTNAITFMTQNISNGYIARFKAIEHPDIKQMARQYIDSNKAIVDSYRRRLKELTK